MTSTIHIEYMSKDKIPGKLVLEVEGKMVEGSLHRTLVDQIQCVEPGQESGGKVGIHQSINQTPAYKRDVSLEDLIRRRRIYRRRSSKDYTRICQTSQKYPYIPKLKSAVPVSDVRQGYGKQHVKSSSSSHHQPPSTTWAAKNPSRDAIPAFHLHPNHVKKPKPAALGLQNFFCPPGSVPSYHQSFYHQETYTSHKVAYTSHQTAAVVGSLASCSHSTAASSLYMPSVHPDPTVIGHPAFNPCQHPPPAAAAAGHQFFDDSHAAGGLGLQYAPPGPQYPSTVVTQPIQKTPRCCQHLQPSAPCKYQANGTSIFLTEQTRPNQESVHSVPDEDNVHRMLGGGGEVRGGGVGGVGGRSPSLTTVSSMTSQSTSSTSADEYNVQEATEAYSQFIQQMEDKKGVKVKPPGFPQLDEVKVKPKFPQFDVIRARIRPDGTLDPSYPWPGDMEFRLQQNSQYLIPQVKENRNPVSEAAGSPRSEAAESPPDSIEETVPRKQDENPPNQSTCQQLENLPKLEEDWETCSGGVSGVTNGGISSTEREIKNCKQEISTPKSSSERKSRCKCREFQEYISMLKNQIEMLREEKEKLETINFELNEELMRVKIMQPTDCSDFSPIQAETSSHLMVQDKLSPLRSSPDGQEYESSEVCKTEETLLDNKDEEDDNDDDDDDDDTSGPDEGGDLTSDDDWKTKTHQLEESLDLMRREFEEMENYWESKLQEERSFYAEQLVINDNQLTLLENQIQDYRSLMGRKEHKRLQILPTIEEKITLEEQVMDCESEIKELRRRIKEMEISNGCQSEEEEDSSAEDSSESDVEQEKENVEEGNDYHTEKDNNFDEEYIANQDYIEVQEKEGSEDQDEKVPETDTVKDEHDESIEENLNVVEDVDITGKLREQCSNEDEYESEDKLEAKVDLEVNNKNFENLSEVEDNTGESDT